MSELAFKTNIIDLKLIKLPTTWSQVNRQIKNLLGNWIATRWGRTRGEEWTNRLGESGQSYRRERGVKNEGWGGPPSGQNGRGPHFQTEFPLFWLDGLGAELSGREDPTNYLLRYGPYRVPDQWARPMWRYPYTSHPRVSMPCTRPGTSEFDSKLKWRKAFF